MNATAIINIARQQLSIEEEAYRALLVRVTGVASLKEMSGRQHIAVIDELKRLGFRVKAGGKTLPPSPKPYIRLIHALWKSCHRAGVIEDGSRTALRTFAKGFVAPKDAKISVDPDLLTYDQARPIIEALKVMERRGKGKTDA
ncbi:regulatory protein GemA [Pararhizobium gei]|uniref:regulatory protein GemA n=1 Tax=Pararhizobium gei TaxID=1395951 RepID=UPI0023DBF13A|nr:regulatory protein GemA [Rhizobium gei]